MHNKFKREYNQIHRLLERGYKVKPRFSKVERVSLSANEIDRLNKRLDELRQLLGVFVYVSKVLPTGMLDGISKGPAIRTNDGYKPMYI